MYDANIFDRNPEQAPARPSCLSFPDRMDDFVYPDGDCANAFISCDRWNSAGL